MTDEELYDPSTPFHTPVLAPQQPPPAATIPLLSILDEAILSQPSLASAESSAHRERVCVADSRNADPTHLATAIPSPFAAVTVTVTAAAAAAVAATAGPVTMDTQPMQSLGPSCPPSYPPSPMLSSFLPSQLELQLSESPDQSAANQAEHEPDDFSLRLELTANEADNEAEADNQVPTLANVAVTVPIAVTQPILWHNVQLSANERCALATTPLIPPATAPVAATAAISASTRGASTLVSTISFGAAASASSAPFAAAAAGVAATAPTYDRESPLPSFKRKKNASSDTDVEDVTELVKRQKRNATQQPPPPAQLPVPQETSRQLMRRPSASSSSSSVSTPISSSTTAAAAVAVSTPASTTLHEADALTRARISLADWIVAALAVINLVGREEATELYACECVFLAQQGDLPPSALKLSLEAAKQRFVTRRNYADFLPTYDTFFAKLCARCAPDDASWLPRRITVTLC